jgi:hypothetical protein
MTIMLIYEHGGRDWPASSLGPIVMRFGVVCDLNLTFLSQNAF